MFFFCRLGDMVMVTRLLNLLHMRFGAPVQVIGTGSWTSAIYEGNPDVARVWSFHRHLPFFLEGGWRQAALLIDQANLRLQRHRRCADPRSGAASARCVFLNDEALASPEHLVDRLQRFGTRTPPALRVRDYPVPSASSVVGPRLYVRAAERAERTAWLLAQGWTKRDLIVIQPGNHRSMGPRRDRWRRLNTDDKWWPLERWAELLQRIHAYNGNAQRAGGSVEEADARGSAPRPTARGRVVATRAAVCL